MSNQLTPPAFDLFLNNLFFVSLSLLFHVFQESEERKDNWVITWCSQKLVQNQVELCLCWVQIPSHVQHHPSFENSKIYFICHWLKFKWIIYLSSIPYILAFSRLYTKHIPTFPIIPTFTMINPLNIFAPEIIAIIVPINLSIQKFNMSNLSLIVILITHILKQSISSHESYITNNFLFLSRPRFSSTSNGLQFPFPILSRT